MATQLTWRQIVLFVIGTPLVFSAVVIVGILYADGGRIRDDERSSLIVFCSIFLVSAAPFTAVLAVSIRRMRQGVVTMPARISPWFHVWFGLGVSLVGIGATLLTAYWARSAGGGITYLFYGMIAWGIIHALVALLRLQLRRT